MRWWLFALVGCAGPSEETDEPDPVETALEETGGETAEPEAPRAIWQNPGEAEDLDPAPDVVRVRLEAAPHAYDVGDRRIEGWAYNGQVPGPTIRVPRGATLEVELTNALPEPTTIHWHGLHVPWNMDGVVWMGSPIAPGDTLVYRFTLDQPAGTYWYHPHFDTARQVDLGLYGVVIVEDPAEPTPDFELIAVLDTWDEFVEEPEANETSHGVEREPSWAVNGLVNPAFEAEVGAEGRMRVVNVTNGAYADVTWPGLVQIGSDQGLLPAAVQPDATLLGPGDRADFTLAVVEDTVVGTRGYSLNGGPTGLPVQPLWEVVAVPGEGSSTALEWPFEDVPPTPDPGTTDIRWTFTGDPRTGAWEMNGETFPEVTIPEVSRDATLVIEVRNMSATDHPFHLHGHAFEVLSIDGEAPSARRMEDTVNLPIRSTARLLLVADNPGDWMAHCHILRHAEGGMMSVLRVLD